MAVGLDTNRLIVGDTIPDGHAPDSDSVDSVPTMPAESAPGHAPKLDIPLRERDHPEAYFQEEREGWHGYIEWERYPEKKAIAANILSQYAFTGVGSLNYSLA